MSDLKRARFARLVRRALDDLPREFAERMQPYLPDRISIFRGPIERMTASPQRQADIVRDTVMHEIAHHFGISDERLRELGRGDAD